MTATDLMTLAEAAQSLGLTDRSGLRHAIRRGTLTAKKYGTTYVVEVAEVERYRARHLGNQGSRRSKATHTPECVARRARGVGGCWCDLVAGAKGGAK